MSRNAWLGPTKRTWLLPRVSCGVNAPHSSDGRTRTRMRGRPFSGRIRRTRVGGRKMRPYCRKRGAKSVTSSMFPASSEKVDTTMAVFSS